jgi:putative ATPase
VLERLTDEEVIEILKRAIARVTSSEQDEICANAAPLSSPATLPHDVSLAHSSPPPSSPLASPRLSSSQTNATVESSLPTPKQSLFPQYPHITQPIITSMASLAAGDARAALSLLEHVILAPTDTSESALLDSMKRSVATSYDRTGDARYDLISALHKSIRGSQGGAALYWLARMLEAGEDPMYIARRLVVCASEDVGMADPHALPVVSAASAKRMVIIALTRANRQ